MARTINPNAQLTRGLNMIKQGTTLVNQAKTGFKSWSSAQNATRSSTLGRNKGGRQAQSRT